MKIMLPLLLALTVITNLSHADELAIPVGQQGSSHAAIAKPKTGMKAEVVEQKFGAPLEKSAAVGQPPVSHWKYANYTVYFESDRVITTVLNPNAAPAPAPVVAPAAVSEPAPVAEPAATEPATTEPATTAQPAAVTE